MIGTEEEARIDAFLYSLNAIGDYYERGNLSIEEISDVAAKYLLIIKNCEAFIECLAAIRISFAGDDADDTDAKTAFRKKFGSPPFRHLCLLLDDLDSRRKIKDNIAYKRLEITKEMRLKCQRI